MVLQRVGMVKSVTGSRKFILNLRSDGVGVQVKTDAGSGCVCVRDTVVGA